MLNSQDLSKMPKEELKKLERELEEDLSIVRWHIRAALAAKKTGHEAQNKSEPPK